MALEDSQRKTTHWQLVCSLLPPSITDHPRYLLWKWRYNKDPSCRLYWSTSDLVYLESMCETQWIYRKHKFLTRLIFNYQLLENKNKETQPPMKKTTNQPNPPINHQPTNQGLVKKKNHRKVQRKLSSWEKTYLFRTLVLPMKKK